MSIKNNKGFSLVELMVVVAIIGILATIAVPNFNRFTAKSKQAEVKSNLSALYGAERAFASEWSAFFGDFRNIGYQPVGNLRYRHGFSASTPCPLGYVGGGVAAGGAAARMATSNANVCGAGLQCTEISPAGNGLALPGVGAAALTQAAFIAGAVGDIDGDATWDRWTMDQNKAMTNGSDDVNN